MPLTPDQEKAVKSNNEPLFIQAGAGTGKTFTLTKRIAHGLMAESGPLIDGVDNLLTITFTNKAAAELIGRVRAELRLQGLDEEALQVDAAWISTIHSMCRRMLLSHAFEMGIDPGSELLSEEDTSALSALALDDMFLEQAEDRRLNALLDVFGLSKAAGLIEELSLLLGLSPEGATGFSLGPEPIGLDGAYRSLAMLFADFKQAKDDLDSMGFPHEKKTYEANYQILIDDISAMHSLIEEEQKIVDLVDLDQRASQLELLKGGSFKQEFKDIFSLCKEKLLDFRSTLHASALKELLIFGLSLAEEHLSKHRELKRLQGALDTNDLLIETYRMLKSDPSLSTQYRRHFDSIMVDEFQDTDTLQVGIIEELSHPGLTNLATVGDAQQSIYGFRGADLEVYRRMRSVMRAQDSKEVELTVNYRSHPDILRFVEDIFSKPWFFGDEFLKVTSGRPDDARTGFFAPGDPRVKILFSAGAKGEGAQRKTSVADLRRADASALADEFEKLHDKGIPYGDMALLMRSTKETYSGAYVHELRRRGIPCVISGGSDFFKLPEVSYLSLLLRVLANRDDDEALFSLLGSPVFNLSDDDLLALSVIVRQKLQIHQDEARSKASLFDGLRAYVKESGEEPLSAASSALHALEAGFERLGSGSVTPTVRDVIKNSGWEETLRKQGVEGGAQYANILRFCDLIDAYEQKNGFAPFLVSEYFRTMIRIAQEGSGARFKPGSLVSSGKDAVSIMTIHSSKGLEFPVVAVAEFEGSGSSSSPGLVTHTEEGKRYLSLGPNAAGALKDHLVAAGSKCQGFEKAQDMSMHIGYAYALEKERAYEEDQRLFYVALTRARDLLIVLMHDGTYATTHSLPDGLSKDALRAVYGEELPVSSTRMTTDAGALLDFQLSVIEPVEASEKEEDKDKEARLHSFPEHEPFARISAYYEEEPRTYSYSSISKRGKVAQAEVPNTYSIKLKDRAKNETTVSPVGSAFHLLTQRAALFCDGGPPTPSMYEAVTRLFDLSSQDRSRLEQAAQAWYSSARYAQVKEYSRIFPEYAFCVDIDGSALEGFIDLVCFGEDGHALVIDYKTGESGKEHELEERYSLQAHCYAYALLSTGLCTSVELVFVRPEVNMQEIIFNFSQEDLSYLEKAILNPMSS